MKYTSKLIIKESAKELNLAIIAFLDSLPANIKLVSCDHTISFKPVAATNDALFSCLIVTAKALS